MGHYDSREDLAGEHPMGDWGQLIFLFVFLIIWIVDSFFLKFSIFGTDFISLFVRIPISLAVLALGLYLVKTGHEIIFGQQREELMVVDWGAFRYVRHPLYAAALCFYMGLFILTLSLFSGMLFIVIFLFYNFIARYEENLLQETSEKLTR